MTRAGPDKAGDLAALHSGDRRIHRQWPGLSVDYAWLPPFEGRAPTRPNRVEVVFSEHRNVALELCGTTYDIDVEAGATYIVGAEPTTLLRVSQFSDTLEMYPSQEVLEAAGVQYGRSGFEFRPTLGTRCRADFVRDPAILGVGHILRRVCLDIIELADIEASCLAYTLVDRVRNLQDCVAAPNQPGKLGTGVLARVCEYIESELHAEIDLGRLAGIARISPFHFSRTFKASTGLPPHQYVLARRMERAKHLLMTTGLPTREVAWTLGYENISHFRRLFAAHLGVTPGVLRGQTLGRRASSTIAAGKS